MRTLYSALPSVPNVSIRDSSIDDADMEAYLQNEYGSGFTAVWEPTPDGGTRVSLLPPQDATQRALAMSAAAAEARAEQGDTSTLAAMPRSRALFVAAVHAAQAHGWIDAEALQSFEWDALACLAALALCMALHSDETMPEVFAHTAALLPLRTACHAVTDAAPALYEAVCQTHPQDPLAQSIRDEAQALCLRDRHRTTLLLQNACKELV